MLAAIGMSPSLLHSLPAPGDQDEESDHDQNCCSRRLSSPRCGPVPARGRRHSRTFRFRRQRSGFGAPFVRRRQDHHGLTSRLSPSPRRPRRPGTFDVSLLWLAGQFVADDGTSPVNPVEMNNFEPIGYQLYAKYNESGTYSASGAVTTFTNTPGTGALSVYINPLSVHQRVESTQRCDSWTINNNGEDYLIAFGTPTGGSAGRLDPTLPTCGGEHGLRQLRHVDRLSI